MNNPVLRKFAAVLLSLAPNLPLPAKEITTNINEFGLEHFIRETGKPAAELAEIAELLALLSKTKGNIS